MTDRALIVAGPSGPDASAAQDAVRRGRDLRRMRLIATGLLALMAVVFVLASIGVRRLGWEWLGYVRAFSEAGMVGACADWFAVTALFRRPFGLPIPHTGIIPRNKERIGDALGRFIADNFLTVEVLDEKLRQLEVARWGGDWLSRPANASRAARRIAAALPGIAEMLPKDTVRRVLAAAATAAVRATPAAPVASGVLTAVWHEGRGQVVIDRVAELLSHWLVENEEVIQEKVAANTYRWLPGFIDKAISKKITAGVLQLLAGVREPEHPVRRQIGEAVEEFIDRLETDPELREKAEALKLRLLADEGLRSQATAVWTDLEETLGSTLRERGDEMAAAIEGGLLSLGQWLVRDAEAQATLNAWARSMVRRVISPRRQEIGLFVAQVVASWDTRSVVEKLELQVGRDLQYIRVNGTLVGGLVGVVIYAASQAMGLG